MKINQFEKFYRKNLDKIYKFVFFRVGQNKELTEDLVSEIFTKALENFEQYDEKKSVSAWIYTIAKNHLANYYRDHSQKIVSLDEIEFDIPIPEEAPASLIGDQSKKELWRLLNALPLDKRQLIILKYLAGYSFQEMSKILGKSKTSLKVACHRVINELKRKV